MSKTVKMEEKIRRVAGGSATGSGMNFQAAVTAIAGVHLIKGRPLGWLEGLVDDTPVAVWAETGGPGDDIKLELRDKSTVEVQVKRGLRTGDKLWASLMSLAHAITEGKISYGVLIVSPDSSRTIAFDLSRDMRRLAEGRTDNLDKLANIFRSKLDEAGLQPQSICRRLRIKVVNGLDSDDASISTAKTILDTLVSDQEDVSAAWNRLYREANAIVERRGRWEASVILRMFVAEGIRIKVSEAPGAVLSRLTHWIIETNRSFSLLGIMEPLSINEAWLPLMILACDFNRRPESEAAETMAHYHEIDKGHSAKVDAKVSDAEWIGRFYPRAVLTGGPGLGKSTLLTKTAQMYAKDGFPVLKVKLSALAARMTSGHTFVDSIFSLGLDGSDVSPNEAMKAGFRNWVLLCDGLDECHNHQETVANGLQKFATGYPQARIIVTTRPIGYSTAELADWRHYELMPPESTSGSANLANLIQAVLPTTHKLHGNAFDISTAELQNCASSEVISRSPLLLGLAASLLVHGGKLGASKAEVYRNLFKLIDNMPNSRSVRQIMSQPVLTRMLDILGWVLVVSPLDSETEILTRCAEHLEVELGETHLKALQIATDCLNHWEGIGLVEKVHHGTEALITFIHKTFTEFAAARYLRDLKPLERQQNEIVNRLDNDAWEEVLNFASGIGLAETIVTKLTTHSEIVPIKHLERALSILIYPEASIPQALCTQIVKLSFDYIDSNDTEDVFSLGSVLAEVAKTHPDLLGSTAQSRLQSPRFSTRLIAWTCAVEAGEEYYELDSVSTVIHALAAEVSQSLMPSLLGGLMLVFSKDRELLQRLAIAFIRRILDVWPATKADQYIKENFNSKPFDTVNYHAEIGELYRSIGRVYEFPSEIVRPSVISMKALRPDDEYIRAERAALQAIISNLVSTEGVADDVDLEQSPQLQLSAFMEIIGFGDVVVTDMWAWTKSYDTEVVREVLQALVQISTVDESALAVEAKAMLRRMDEQTETDSYSVLLPTASVDVPPPEWSDVKALQINRSNLEQALNYESMWFVHAATNLLSGLGGTTVQESKELLANGHSYGLAAAAFLTFELGPEVAVELILDRLEGPDTLGLHYLIIQLIELEPPLDKRLMAIMRTGLMSSNAKLAVEVATLAVKYVESGELARCELLNEAFHHWIVHEKPYPQNSGLIPDSPRNTLLKGMLTLGTINDKQLINHCRDMRRDVQGTANDELLSRITVSKDTRASFVNEIVAKLLPESLLSRALVTKVPFSEIEINQLRLLLEDEDAKWRLAASKLLDPSYLGLDVIRETVDELLLDSHPEVRHAAARALDDSVT